MSITVLRQKSLRIDLDPLEAENPHLNNLLLDKLRNTYERTCMDRSYVLRITRILGRPGMRVWNPRKMNGEMGTTVMFEYEAEILIPQSEVKTQVVLHGGNVVEVTEIAGGVLATCSFGDHITGTVIIDLHGIITPGMTIPIRVSDAEYPQNIMNNISVAGELLKPTHFNSRSFLISAATDADMAAGQKIIDVLNAEIAEIIGEYKRAQYFKAWLYPYKEAPERKTISLPTLLTKRETKAMYIMIDDACDIGNLEFIQTEKVPIVEPIRFLNFVTTYVDEARMIWMDVKKFAEIYDDDEIFATHKTIWKYYDSLKFNELPKAPVKIQKIKLPAENSEPAVEKKVEQEKPKTRKPRAKKSTQS